MSYHVPRGGLPPQTAAWSSQAPRAFPVAPGLTAEAVLASGTPS